MQDCSALCRSECNRYQQGVKCVLLIGTRPPLRSRPLSQHSWIRPAHAGLTSSCHPHPITCSLSRPLSPVNSMSTMRQAASGLWISAAWRNFAECRHHHPCPSPLHQSGHDWKAIGIQPDGIMNLRVPGTGRTRLTGIGFPWEVCHR